MNIRKLFGLGLVGLGNVFAQQVVPANQPSPVVNTQPVVEEQVAPPTQDVQPVEEQAPTPTPVVQEKPVVNEVVTKSEPAVVETVAVVEESKPSETLKDPFDVLHGSAYNSVGNEAAADNVDSFLGRPDKFAGQKFFYVEPAKKRGIASFGKFFGALDISGDLGRITAGYASSGFGMELKAGFGHRNVDTPEGEKFTTYAGDDLGLTLSQVLGGLVVSLNVDWLTYREEIGIDPVFGSSTDERYRDLDIGFGVSNAPGAKKIFWSAGLDFERHLEETEFAGEIAFDSSASSISFSPFFNVGTLALKREQARVYVGLNTRFPVTMLDDKDVVNEDGDKESLSAIMFEAFLAPNILGEVVINSSFLFFGEATYEWLAFGYYSADAIDGDLSAMESTMDKVTADIGFRYQYEDFLACEFAFGDSFFTDTKSIFNGEGVFISFGAFLYF